jgi:RsiW-degrading membrane proteinase PrsW (M82 family)
MLNAETSVALEGAEDWQPLDVAFANLPKPPLPKITGNGALSKLAAGVGAVAGLESSESGGGFRSIFKDVFKKRTIEDMERQFAVGIPETTPPVGQLDTHWPAPWVFFRLITFSVVATFGFYWLLMRMQDPVVLPAWIFVGAFGIPFSVLVFFMEANVLRNVSFYRVLKLFMLGGLLSLIFTTIFNEVTGLGNWMGWSAAGPIEEVAKILAVVAFAAKWRDKFWSLNGMLFGAAVGAGFAAFETAGYILARSDGNFEMTMFIRALYAPFTHVIWTAATAAALWRVMGSRKFEFGMLIEWQFLRVLLFIAAIHALWNSSIVVPMVGMPLGLQFKFLGLGVIGWFLIILLIHDGLAQIRKAQQVAPAQAEPSVLSKSESAPLSESGEPNANIDGGNNPAEAMNPIT